MLARTAVSLVGLGLFLSAGSAFAQQPADGGTTLNFHKEPKTLTFTKDAEPSTFVPAAPVPLTPPSAPIRRTAMQQPAPKLGDMRAADTGDQGEYSVQLEPPGPQRLFRLESERSLQERMRQEALQRPNPERINFPEEPDVSGGRPWQLRAFAPSHEVVEPCYLCYGKLFFEERNSERFGWDLGWIQPFVSAANFYKDVALLAYHWGSDPCGCSDCDSGYCLPGDPVPYVLYPPGLSVKGLVAEGAAWVGLAAICP